MLIYDGACGFCTRCAEWVRRRLPAGREIVAWQQIPDLGTLGLTVADVTGAAYWIDADGRTHRGARGVAMTLIEIGGFWTVIGRLLLVPPVRGPPRRPCTGSSLGSAIGCQADQLSAEWTTVQWATSSHAEETHLEPCPPTLTSDNASTHRVARPVLSVDRRW